MVESIDFFKSWFLYYAFLCKCKFFYTFLIKKSHRSGFLFLSNNTCVTALDSSKCLYHRVRCCESCVLVIDSSTVLTEGDSDTITWCPITTLTREYKTLSSNGHLMEEPLILECIDDTIECCEIHTAISLSDESFFEITKSDARIFTKSFDEPFALFGDTSIRHRNQWGYDMRSWGTQYSQKSYKRKCLRVYFYLFFTCTSISVRNTVIIEMTTIRMILPTPERTIAESPNIAVSV